MQLKLDSNTYPIKFNGKSSADFGVKMISKKIGFPSATKIKIDVPFSEIPIDMSGIYGDQKMSERTNEYEFLIRDADNLTKEGLYRQWTNFINDFAMQVHHKAPLMDDVMENYFYLAEVENAPSWEEYLSLGTINLKFTCYPYRISIKDESDDDDNWDDFDLEDGVAQMIEYEVNDSSKTVYLLNVGAHMLVPEIEVNGDVTLNTGKDEVKLNEGTSTYEDIVLLKGLNTFTITGKGTIKFHFRREVI